MNGVNLGFASNQKITESYKDVTKFYTVVKLNICIGDSFLSDMGVVNLIFFFVLFFLYEKFLLSFMLIIIQKKSFQPHKVLTQLDGNHM